MLLHLLSISIIVLLIAFVFSSNQYDVRLKIWDNTDCSGDPIENEQVSEGNCIVCDGCGSDAYRVTCSDGGSTITLKSYSNDDCTNADNAFDFTDDGGECLNNGPGFSFKAVCKKDDDDSDNVCFHGDELVALDSGVSKRIADVVVGDRIQVMRMDSTLAFSDVVFMPHKENSILSTFVELETESKRTLKVTSEHLVVNGACTATTYELTRASDIQLGSCVRTINGMDKVSRITTVKDKGIYTVVTADLNGMIVVNGIVASSFGTNHIVPNMFYMLHRAMYSVLPQWMMESESFKATNMFIGGLFIAASAPFRG